MVEVAGIGNAESDDLSGFDLHGVGIEGELVVSIDLDDASRVCSLGGSTELKGL
ncbi:MAG: hypothetical protein M5U19_07170 [Microthrixaceae bacterium]|nr:hypothetical protein [Microthrixaceae bacterium]